VINAYVSNGILILLTLFAAHATGHVSLLLALGGALMILVTAGYVNDGGGRLLKTAQLFLAVLFALCAGNWWGCLVFATLLWPKAWETHLAVNVTAVLLFFVYGLAGSSRSMAGGERGAAETFGIWNAAEGELGPMVAALLVCLILMNLICGGILFCRWLVEWLVKRGEEEKRRVLAYRLSEMHEVQKNKELMRQSFYVEKNARYLERENISRNIHNSVGHSITAAIMTLDAADLLFDKKPEEAHKRMNDATERIRGSLSAIRSAVRALDSEAEDVSVKDLICYFDNVLDAFLMDTDRSCDRVYEFYDEERSIPREHAEFLTGALEELLTNGVKHGGAKHFVVRLSGDSSHLRLEVKDDGESDFSEETSRERIKNGFGLKKLTAYAERCGGKTEFGNENGFRSVIELPL